MKIMSRKEWLLANQEKVKGYKRKWAKSNPEKVKESNRRFKSSTKGAIYMREYNESHREETRLRARTWYHANKDRAKAARLKKQFGLTLEEWNSMLIDRAGRCDICEEPMTAHLGPCIDHDHSTGKVRGMLCETCNTAIGKLPSGQLLRMAALYLESYGEEHP